VLVIEVQRFGGPEVLVPADSPDPGAGPGELVVAVTASDVMFLDTMIRSGRGAGLFPIQPPYVPGNGVTGRVIGVGDGVDGSWAGRPVIAHTGDRVAVAATPSKPSSSSTIRFSCPTASTC
jgi:NADPH2:quinone reductase